MAGADGKRTPPEITISPKELIFEGNDQTKPIARHLVFTNLHDTDVCFKVKTTAPRRYYVRPNAVRLRANTTATVEVVLRPQSTLPPINQRKDKFLVQVAWLDDPDPTLDTTRQCSTWWKALEQNGGVNKVDWKEIRMKSTLKFPPATPIRTQDTGTAFSTPSSDGSDDLMHSALGQDSNEKLLAEERKKSGTLLARIKALEEENQTLRRQSAAELSHLDELMPMEGAGPRQEGSDDSSSCAYDAGEKDVALAAFVQGLGYLQSRRVDLSSPVFGNVKEEQVVALTARTPDMEALFLTLGTTLSESAVTKIRQRCPHAACIALGCEISENAYLLLREQYCRSDGDLAPLLLGAASTEPSAEASAVRLQRLRRLEKSEAEMEADAGFSSERQHDDAGMCRVLDLSGSDFLGLTDTGFVEIPRLCPRPQAVFLASDSQVTSAGLADFHRQAPGVQLLRLGAEITRADAIALLRGFHQDHLLNLASQGLERITNAGLSELCAICSFADLQAIVYTKRLFAHAKDALVNLQQSCTSANYVLLDEEVTFAARNAAVEAKDRLDSLQEELRTSGSSNLKELCRSRDAARREFITAADALSATLAPGSVLANHIRYLSEKSEKKMVMGMFSAACRDVAAVSMSLDYPTMASVPHQVVKGFQDLVSIAMACDNYSFALADKVIDMTKPSDKHGGNGGGAVPASEEKKQESTEGVGMEAIGDPNASLAAWRRAEAQAQHFAVLALEYTVDDNKPTQLIEALQTLQDENQSLRTAVKMSEHRVGLLEGEMSSPVLRHTGGEQQLQQTQPAPEQCQSRSALLAQPINKWSVQQVQEWVGIIGLSSEQILSVQQALAKDVTDGEDLKEMTKKRLQKLLQRVGVDHAAELAEETLALHEAAQGETLAQSKMATAKAELAASRQTLRNNSIETRACVVDLVSLAVSHFPELLHHEVVKSFMGSDGLQIPDRRLSDYDDIQPLAMGRLEVLHAKFNGGDVILKRFPLNTDMSGYLKEIRNVQRLQHRHIIRYDAVFEDAGSMYIEMEWCKYGQMTQWIASSNPDAAQKQSVLRQILLALACMHEQAIVHCDLKGENILIAEDGTARICDFELSKDLGLSAASTMIGGTLGFIAPEVQSRQAKPSPSSDMYSFGVLALNTLYPPAATNYPTTDSSIVNSVDHEWIVNLIDREPSIRPSAVRLQAEPYFEIDRVTEARAQEAEAAATKVANQLKSERAIPEYWSNKSVDSDAKQVLCADLCIGRHKVYSLMRSSIQPGHEGGCGPGACLHNLRVTRLERVENMTLWLNYQRQKTAMRERLRFYSHTPEQLLGRMEAQTNHSASGSFVLDHKINEFGLWHGTKPETAKILATSGFDERLAELHGLYGAGSYFADAMCKSNQYATHVNSVGEHCILYCRVTMGSAYKTRTSHKGVRRPPNNPASPGAPFDSIFAEAGVANGGTQVHNEFVVFRHDQVYPEYVVWYTTT